MTVGHDLSERVALNADIVGYSRLLADHPAATSASMAAIRTLVDERVGVHGGIVASFVGDNFMALFDDPKDAVHAAIDVTRSVEAHSEATSDGGDLRFRMGLDRGTVARVDGDIEGEALNIAARIQAVAPEGGIAVSGSVYRALDEPALRFRATGERRLKNLPEPVEIYEFVGLPSHGQAVSADPLALEAPTLAVLPIHNDAVDDRVRPLGDLVRADILHRLASIPGLITVDAAAPMPETGSSQPARYMLETGIYQFGDAVRIFATLFDVTTMNVVKSLKWATSVDGVLALSDEVSGEVGRAIEVEIVVGAPAGLYAELDDPDAIEDVYLGWFHMRSDTRDGWTEALRLFGEVAESHPDAPYGHVLRAYALWLGAANGWTADPAATFHEVRALAQRARKLGDPTGMGQALDAAALMSLGEIEAAAETMDQLEIVRPTCDVTYALGGSVRRYLGEWDTAVDLLDVAMRLTGVNKPWYPTVKACSLFLGNRLDEAVAVAEGVLEVQPNNLEALLVLAAAQHELGLDRRAEATAADVRRRFPSTDIGAWLAQSPYSDEGVVERWTDDLRSVGLVESR